MSRLARWGAALAVAPLIFLTTQATAASADDAGPTIVGASCSIAGSTDPLATDPSLVAANITGGPVVTGDPILAHTCTVQVNGVVKAIVNGVIARNTSVVEGQAFFQAHWSDFIELCTHLQTTAVSYTGCEWIAAFDTGNALIVEWLPSP